MKKEYDLAKMKSRKNPYAKRLKQQITLRLDPDVIEYFKAMSVEKGIPYQSLINLYLPGLRSEAPHTQDDLVGVIAPPSKGVPKFGDVRNSVTFTHEIHIVEPPPELASVRNGPSPRSPRPPR